MGDIGDVDAKPEVCEDVCAWGAQDDVCVVDTQLGVCEDAEKGRCMCEDMWSERKGEIEQFTQ